MLSELEAILDEADDDAPVDMEKDLRATARALLDRQFIFSDDRGGAKPFELVRTHRAYFENLFDALGFTLIVEPAEWMIGIENHQIDTRGTGRGRRMKVEDAVFLVALRIIYENRVKAAQMKMGAAGRCEATLGEVWDVVEERTGRPRPPASTCDRIVRVFKRNGIVKPLQELTAEDMVLEIRPVIRRVVTTATIDSLQRYASAMASGGAQTDEDASDEDQEDA